MVAAISPASVQISRVAVSAAASDYCCNDPGCNCKGGREAKQALEARREQSNIDQVSVSAAGLAALRAEAVAPVDQAAANSNTLTVNAAQPPAALQTTVEARKATETELLQAVQAPPSPSQASSLPDRQTANALNAYLAAARSEDNETKSGALPPSLDAYA